jgi:hypothetical protein
MMVREAKTPRNIGVRFGLPTGPPSTSLGNLVYTAAGSWELLVAEVKHHGTTSALPASQLIAHTVAYP